MKKIFKVIFILFLTIIIPILIIITILFANEKELLIRFLNWISIEGNLTAFIVSVGLYFPMINGFLRLILTIINWSNLVKKTKKNKKTRIKIYDDEKNNYIYFDKINNILDFQFKAIENVDLEKLVFLAINELKSRVELFENKK